MNRDDTNVATILGIAATDYVASNFIHEGLGHGSACLAAGGAPLELTSAWLECAEGGLSPWSQRVVAAGGTVANLVAGAVALLVVQRMSRSRGTAYYAIWLFAAINLLSAGGYLLTSPLFGFGDWGAFLDAIASPLAWKIGLTAIGAGISAASLLALYRLLVPSLGDPGAARIRRARLFCLLPYAFGGALISASGLRNPEGVAYAFSNALSTFGGTAFLASLPAWDNGATSRGPKSLEVGKSPAWIVLGLLSMAIVLGVLGPGVKGRGRRPHVEGGRRVAMIEPPHGPTVRSSGGPVLVHPRLVAVTFTNDSPSDVARIEQMITGLASTEYWKVTAEYGVGDLRTELVRSTDEAPSALEDADVARWVREHASMLGYRADDLVLLIYPRGTSVEHADEHSCREFYGYHASTPLDGEGSRRIPYAVLPRCRPRATDADPLDTITTTLSHEVIEAAVNPFPETTPAFAHVDEAHVGWELEASGGAPTDLCTFVPRARFRPKDLPFFVQRIWSNASALRGEDPCVPAPSDETYFAAVPRLREMSDVRVPNLRARAEVVNVPVGERRTVDVVLYASGPSPDPGPYEVSADDGLPEDSAILRLTFDRPRAFVGESLRLTIESLQPSADLVFPFKTRARRGAVEHTWIGLVTQEDVANAN